jgi:hypothetical protein
VKAEGKRKKAKVKVKVKSDKVGTGDRSNMLEHDQTNNRFLPQFLLFPVIF